MFRCIPRTIAWLFSLIILRVERTKTMPTAQTRGHGLTILTFWCIAALIELLALISYRSPLWFFQSIAREVSSIEEIHKVRFGYWIFRLIVALLIFFIGLRAPGVPHRLHQSQSLIEDKQIKENIWLKSFKYFRT